MCLKRYLILAALFFLFSCNEEPTPPSGGTADFREYVAVGNSLTAGYSDGGLYRAAQLNSYPAILSKQLSLNSGLTFVQPLMPAGSGSGYIELLAYQEGSLPAIRYVEEDPRAFDKVTGPFHNLGVPGIRVKDIDMEDYGIFENNNYFYRMLPAGAESRTSYLDLVEASEHSFFTCWMGDNDVLGFATSGGVYGEDGYGEYERSGLTDIAEFEMKYNLMIDKLAENGAKGVIMTIPDILYVPYFNVITNEYFPDLSANDIEQLNKEYEEINELIERYNESVQNNETLSEEEKQRLYREIIHFSSSGNAFVIEDKSLPDIDMTDSNGDPVPQIRHFKEGDKITLPGILKIANASGTSTPLGDRYVLTSNEIELIESYRTQYNAIIRNAALSQDIALLDVDAILKEFRDGKTVGGVFLSAEIVTGGLFSLDGIHLTQRGYALVANKIIEKINAEFGAEIPKVNLAAYPAVEVPG